VDFGSNVLSGDNGLNGSTLAVFFERLIVAFMINEDYLFSFKRVDSHLIFTTFKREFGWNYKLLSKD